ncbi:MAG: hypothetical protein IJE21_00355 [Alistipes sp.]|nr:hypothetical protein [Alistipes sp.]
MLSPPVAVAIGVMMVVLAKTKALQAEPAVAIGVVKVVYTKASSVAEVANWAMGGFDD